MPGMVVQIDLAIFGSSPILRKQSWSAVVDTPVDLKDRRPMTWHHPLIAAHGKECHSSVVLAHATTEVARCLRGCCEELAQL